MSAPTSGRLRRLVGRLAAVSAIAGLGVAAVATPALAAGNYNETKTTSCEVKWTYTMSNGRTATAIYKAAAKVVVTKNAGKIVSVGWPSITQDSMWQGGSYINEYVTATTYATSSRLYLAAAGYATGPKWVSCSSSTGL